MATIDLGKLGFVNKGTYNNSTTYEKNDLVQFTDGGILSTYLYIDSTAQSGQAPSSSGTAGSRWVYFAKGVADAVASAGNNKVLVTDGSGSLSPLSIGSAGQSLKVNSGANGFEFGAIVAGLVQVVTFKDTSVTSASGQSWNATSTTVNITPTSASNKIFVIASGILDSASASQQSGATIFRDSTNLGSNNHGMTQIYTGGDRTIAPCTMHILDSPNTTSQITYKVYVNENGSQNVEWNGQSSHAHITAMEVAV